MQEYKDWYADLIESWEDTAFILATVAGVGFIIAVAVLF